MGSPLHILVVDDWPDSVVDLVGRLAARSHRVQVVGNGLEAINRITQARAANDPVHLALIDFNLPDIDGASLVRELRRRGDQVAAAFISSHGSLLNRARTEAQNLSLLGVLSKPANAADVDYLLNAADNARRSMVGTSRSDDAPFFGTTRLFKRNSEPAPSPMPTQSDALTPLAPPPTRRQTYPFGAEPPAAPGVPPQPTYRRPPSQLIPMDQGLMARDPVTGRYKTPAVVPVTEPNPRTTQGDQPGTISRTGRTTSLFNRQPEGQRPVNPPPQGAVQGGGGGTGGAAANSGTSRTQANTTSTIRLRRGVGTNQPEAPPPGAAPSSRAVACAYCRGLFQVPVKAEAFTVICVHCGKPNQILPL